MISDYTLLIKQVQRELVLQARQIKYVVNSCLFFVMLLFIFPMTVKPDILLMKTIAPGFIWMAILLSMMLSAEQLFGQDYEHGVLEQWLVSGRSLTLLIGAKVFAHWFFHLIPLLILSPLAALFFSFSLWEVWILLLTLICGTPALFFLGALASSFGLGLHQRGALMALILLPLTLPLLIFGSGTLPIAMQGLPVSGYLALLGAISLLAVGFIPYAISGVIRINSEEN